MDHQQLKIIVEAALFASGHALTLEDLETLFTEEERPKRAILREILAELRIDYAERGLELMEVASGYRFQVKAALAPWIKRLFTQRPPRYSRALLETLALIAYRQPITRGEIETIRGVSVSSQIIKTLRDYQWIRVLAYRESPGRPALYGTTRAFLDHFNLKSLDELPSLMSLQEMEKFPLELPEEDNDSEEVLKEESE
jgi:segregation and condensation protein B